MRKTRPAAVMSVDAVGRLPLRIVALITDWKPHYADLPWIVHLPPDASNGLTKDSGADGFQIKSVPGDRFTPRLGALNDDQVANIAGAIALCIGFVP